MVTWDNLSDVQKKLDVLSNELQTLHKDFQYLVEENIEIRRILKVLYERLSKNEK